MKLLLTGVPKSGKTTLLKQLITELSNSIWVVADQIIDNEGNRQGFFAVSSLGANEVIAHKMSIKSDVRIGDYRVDVAAINKVYVGLINQVIDSHTNKWAIIDEIGRMQIKSSLFHNSVNRLFAEKANVLATIRFSDKWTSEYIDRTDVITFTLTLENKTDVELALRTCMRASDHIDQLSIAQSTLAYSLAKEYLLHEKYTQFGKLFNNAIPYAVLGKVEVLAKWRYLVKGKNGNHDVTFKQGKWTCDCELNRGEGVYYGMQGICSHIMASRLSRA